MRMRSNDAAIGVPGFRACDLKIPSPRRDHPGDGILNKRKPYGFSSLTSSIMIRLSGPPV